MTPDSFFDGLNNQPDNNIKKIENRLESELLDADIIDIGGESSRPGAEKISYQEEIDRISILRDKILKLNNRIFSIDTYKYEVAKYALENGYTMINDTQIYLALVLALVAALLAIRLGTTLYA